MRAPCDLSFDWSSRRLGRRGPPIEQPIKPRESRGGAVRRTVLAADKAVVLQIVERLEDVAVVDFADVRLVPVRHARDLHVADMRQPLSQLRSEIALDDLRMVEIHL